MSEPIIAPPPYAIIGVGDGLYPRLEISYLKDKEPKQFSLFIKALNNIQKPDYKYEGNDAPNWAQMAGIHGAPYVRWSGDPAPPHPIRPEGTSDTAQDDDRWLGYCHHRDPFFPTWHRVDVMLIEQAVWREAQAIVNAVVLTDKREWIDAANRLRFPYWDWTREVTGSTYLPDYFKESNIPILNFNGKVERVQNPLHTYHIPLDLRQATGWPADHAPDTDNWFTSWSRTYRWPENKGDDPKENYDALNDAFIKGGPGSRQNNVTWLRDKVAHLFTYRLDVEDKWGGNCWDFFSSVHYAKTPSGYGPHQSPPPYDPMPPALEEPHDTVHLDLGNNGHMGANETAGFDPIFYLHHCNIDRIYAFWEYVYPKFWIGKGFYNPDDDQTHSFVDIQGTFTERVNQPIDSESNLTPFRKANRAYWTSDDVYGLQVGQGQPKYYTYPPIGDVDVLKPLRPELQRTYISQLQRHFGLQTSQPVKLRPVFKAPVFQSPPTDVHGGFNSIPSEYEPLENFRIFVIVVTVDESAYKGSFHVELRAQAAPNVLVNKSSFLRRTDTNYCSACIGREEQGSLARAVMILNSIEIQQLLDEAGRNNENTDDIDAIDVLKNAFFVRVVGANLKVLAESGPQYYSLSPSDSARGPVLQKGRPTLELYSAAAAQNDAEHVEFYDWKSHATLLDHEQYWVDRRQATD